MCPFFIPGSGEFTPRESYLHHSSHAPCASAGTPAQLQYLTALFRWDLRGSSPEKHNRNADGCKTPSEQMQKRWHFWSWSQCQVKAKELRQKYLMTRDKNRTSDNALTTHSRYEELNCIFACDAATITPKTHVVDSFPESTQDVMAESLTPNVPWGLTTRGFFWTDGDGTTLSHTKEISHVGVLPLPLQGKLCADL